MGEVNMAPGGGVDVLSSSELLTNEVWWFS